MFLKTISLHGIALVSCLSALNASFAQEPVSQQVPGAAARLKREYSETAHAFLTDNEAVKAPIVIQWAGELNFQTEKKHPLPKNGIIDDENTLNTLWGNWRLGVAPKVDFDNFVILAATGGDNSARFEVLTKLKKTGDLQFQFVPADLVKTGGPRYFIFVVSRKDVKAFNGYPIGRDPQKKSVNPIGQSSSN